LNEFFQFPSHVFIICISKAIQSQATIIIKLMHYEQDDFNNKKHQSSTLVMTYKQSLQTWCKVG